MVVNLDTYRKTRQLALSIPFGEWLKNFRNNARPKITQEQLAQMTGYHRAVISRWETGALEIYPHEAANVAKALGERELAEYYCMRCPVANCIRMMDPKPAV